MFSLDNLLIARFTLTAGISALLQVTLLILMFTVSKKPFGRMSDYFYVLTPLLMLPLFLSIQKMPAMQNAAVSGTVRVIGIIGLLTASGTEVVLLLNLIDFKQSVWGNAIGLGLMGIPILTFAIMNLGNSALPAAYNWFVFGLGIIMVIGIPAVFVFIEEFYAISHGGDFNLKQANPLVYPAVLAGLLVQVGLPVWLFWTAGLMLTGTMKLIG
jgi:hypothetical protein